MKRLMTTLMLVSLMALTAQAQTTEAPETWRATIGEQLTTLLAAPDAATRAEAMRLTLDLTHRHGDLFDLTMTAPKLVEIYAWDRQENHRMMALAALHALQDAYGLQRIAELLPQEKSPRLRRVAAAIVQSRHDAR